MGLVNSDGNYAVITNTDKQRVDVMIYASKAKYDLGLDPFFEKSTPGNFHCGEELNESYNTTAASGAGGKTVADNVILAAQGVVVAQAIENPERHRIQMHVPNADPVFIKGDWTIWVAE